MKVKSVLLVGKIRTKPRTSSEVWDRYGFQQVGVNCKLINVDGKNEHQIIVEIRQHRADLVIYYHTHGVSLQVVRATKHVGKVRALNTFDRMAARKNGPSAVLKFLNVAEEVDFVFHTGGVPECKKAIRIRQGCEPLRKLKKPKGDRKGKPVFVGNDRATPSRRLFCGILKTNKVDIVGHKRETTYADQALFNLCHTRSVVLGDVECCNINAMWEISGYFSNRLYVMTGYGACLLHTNVPGIEEEYVPDKEIVLYNNYKEMLRKLEKLRCDPVRCNRIGEAAYKRARRDHTYVHRAQRIVDVIEKGVF